MLEGAAVAVNLPFEGGKLARGGGKRAAAGAAEKAAGAIIDSRCYKANSFNTKLTRIPGLQDKASLSTTSCMGSPRGLEAPRICSGTMAYLKEVNVCTTKSMPECFKPVQEDATPSLNPQLSQLFPLSVPTIARILAVDEAHPNCKRAAQNVFSGSMSSRWPMQSTNPLPPWYFIATRGTHKSRFLKCPHIAHAGRHILYPRDLPVPPAHVPRRERESDGEEVFLAELVPKRHKPAGKKIVRTAIPPGVRRSSGLKKGIDASFDGRHLIAANGGRERQRAAQGRYWRHFYRVPSEQRNGSTLAPELKPVQSFFNGGKMHRHERKQGRSPPPPPPPPLTSEKPSPLHPRPKKHSREANQIGTKPNRKSPKKNGRKEKKTHTVHPLVEADAAATAAYMKSMSLLVIRSTESSPIRSANAHHCLPPCPPPILLPMDPKAHGHDSATSHLLPHLPKSARAASRRLPVCRALPALVLVPTGHVVRDATYISAVRRPTSICMGWPGGPVLDGEAVAPEGEAAGAAGYKGAEDVVGAESVAAAGEERESAGGAGAGKMGTAPVLCRVSLSQEGNKEIRDALGRSQELARAVRSRFLSRLRPTSRFSASMPLRSPPANNLSGTFPSSESSSSSLSSSWLCGTGGPMSRREARSMDRCSCHLDHYSHTRRQCAQRAAGRRATPRLREAVPTSVRR
ncbi:hypothetical protein K438DRAFT_1782370 [Mycena galopus ATCC 62051]|nr:hypothetical protein K438DRAFT_1782370 [Mycena galopus ATCC 62051]